MIKETGKTTECFSSEHSVNDRLDLTLVTRFGKEHVEPYVREMEEAGRYKPELIQKVFDQGVSDDRSIFCVCSEMKHL